MADDFKPGDVVQLRSGGFPMTVGSQSQQVEVTDGEVTAVSCSWMTAGGEIRCVSLSTLLLTAYVPEPRANPHPTRDDELPPAPTRDNY